MRGQHAFKLALSRLMPQRYIMFLAGSFSKSNNLFVPDKMASHLGKACCNHQAGATPALSESAMKCPVGTVWNH
jgi:hypothetical protein